MDLTEVKTPLSRSILSARIGTAERQHVHYGLGWIGLDGSGLGWIGWGRTGVGLDWSGVGSGGSWIGLGFDGI